MEAFNVKTLVEISGLLINVVVLAMNSRIRADIAELKIWVLENFERRNPLLPRDSA